MTVPASPSPTTPGTTDRQLRRLGGIAVAGVVAFVALFLVMHALQPDLNPLTRFGSEYVWGTGGWLMKLAFVGFAAALACLAVAFGWQIRPPLRSRAAGILLTIATLGIVASALFNADLQTAAESTWQGLVHDLSGFAAFLTLLPAMVAIGGRLRKNRRPRGTFLLALAWVSVALFLALMFLFGPLGLEGLGQRIYLAALMTWLFVAGRGLATGAFTRHAEAAADAA